MTKKQSGAIGIILLGVILIVISVSVVYVYLINKRRQLTDPNSWSSATQISRPLSMTEKELPVWLYEMIKNSKAVSIRTAKCIYQNRTTYEVITNEFTNISGSSLYEENGNFICTPAQGGFMGGKQDDRCHDFYSDQTSCQDIDLSIESAPTASQIKITAFPEKYN